MDRQIIGIPLKRLAEEKTFKFSRVRISPVPVRQISSGAPVKIERNSISYSVPAYITHSAILQVAYEISDNMSAVPGGKFSKAEKEIPAAQKIKDSVTIAPFFLGKYEITQRQWQQVMGYNNSENKECQECPVETVSWNEVAEFIRILNEYSPVSFRLPTNAEWEYAVRLDTREYIDKRGGLKYGDLAAWYEKNSGRKPHPVGKKIPHNAGAYDLMGNVAEWCFDWFDPEYLKYTRDRQNPVGASAGTKKIVRGGTYANSNFIETKYVNPMDKQKTIGFRLVQNN
ncbi:MAG: hypothetical protein EOO01_36255 [Chitinophagaceae bacterium]|nr:MAG: hypothetical protein EOO01_36255 [Chitinophagaceae bacterium]